MNRSQETSLSFTLNELEMIANNLYLLKDRYKVYTFSGPLGAGKTTMVKELIKQFGVTTAIVSPTFSYVNVYENTQGQLLYHFDLYRLAHLQEFLEAGFDEFLYLNKSWTFIEWPEIITPLLTHQVCTITIDYNPINHEQRDISYLTL